MNVFAWKFYEHYRDRSRVFSELIGSSPNRFKMSAGDGEAETVTGEYVVGDYFTVLGIQPAIGRVIAPADDRLDGGDPAVAVLSWSYWDARWQQSPSVLGSRLLVDGVPATVIGVAPREFAGLQPGLGPRVWLPTAMEPLVRRPSRRLDGQRLSGVEILHAQGPASPVAPRKQGSIPCDGKLAGKPIDLPAGRGIPDEELVVTLEHEVPVDRGDGPSTFGRTRVRHGHPAVDRNLADRGQARVVLRLVDDADPNAVGFR